MLSCFFKSQNNNNITEYDIFQIYGFIIFGLYLLYCLFKILCNMNRFKDIKFYNSNSDTDRIQILGLNNLDHQMKLYEYTTMYNLSDMGIEKPFIIRLNGRNFKKIKNKENYLIHLHMVSMELMKEFHVQTAMVFNNEINLICFPLNNPHFNGRYTKLQSVIASYAASSLSLKLNTVCSFHCNIVDFSNNNMDLLNYIKWRYYQAKSIRVLPYFIKRQYIDMINKQNGDLQNVIPTNNDKPKYKHVKFLLNSNMVKMKESDEYFKLFTKSNLNTTEYNIKLPKLYEMNEILVNKNYSKKKDKKE